MWGLLNMEINRIGQLGGWGYQSQHVYSSYLDQHRRLSSLHAASFSNRMNSNNLRATLDMGYLLVGVSPRRCSRTTQTLSISLLTSPSESRQTESHNHRKQTNLITWTTAFCSSMKLWAMLCRATQDGWVMVESSDKMQSTGKGNGKPLQYSCLENPMNSMKRQKDKTLKDEFPRSVGAQYATGDQWRKNEELQKEWRDGAKAKTTPSCGCDWW